MKKITQKAVEALLNQKNFKLSNTEVKDGNLYLFGYNIAHYENNTLWITLAGWNTQTTRERLNGLPNVNIKVKNFIPYLNGEEMDVYKIYKIKI